MAKLKTSLTELKEHERRLIRAGLQLDPRMCTQCSDNQNGEIFMLDKKEATELGEWCK